MEFEFGPYEQFIYKRTYSRWLDDKQRRETFDESVDRYKDFFAEKALPITQEFNESIEQFKNLDIVPSMRAFFTAGEALKRENIAGYNCCAVVIDHKDKFSELLYILMNGTGVGFSVERQFINDLPNVPDVLSRVEDSIVFDDSKEGWAQGIKEYINALYDGKICVYDLSKIRPKGSRLKTFGGKASGPEPLEFLIKQVIRIFEKSKGRKLRSIECHDICCYIANSVVVGGVRRSACISLSNLSDDRMKYAKDGEFWTRNPQRALANNSVAYTEKPDINLFMDEWVTLMKSGTGERGVFNRKACEKIVSKNKRRKHSDNFVTNPCCFTGETLIAVADGSNFKTIEELSDYSNGVIQFPVYSARTAKKGHWKAEIKNAVAKYTATKDVYLVKLSNGDTFKCTDDHLLAKPDGTYVQAKNSVGIELESFFTVLDGRRRINSFTNGYSNQYRMIWEFHNDEKPFQYEIDHIENDGGDFIDNLQLLSNNEHTKKTGIEQTGYNNSAHRIKDKEKFKYNLSCSMSQKGNPNYSGLSNNDLIKIGNECLNRGWKITRPNCLKINSSFPKSFSEFRFNGKFSNFKKAVLGEYDFVEPTLPEKIINEKDNKTYLSEKIHVVSIEYKGSRKVYDLSVEDNNNFYIINKKFDNNADECRGILVHNSEIILRPQEFCNLSEVVIRPNDTLEELKEKITGAVVFGCLQATLTDFNFISDEYKDNCEEERLLGVSLTGLRDHEILKSVNPESKKYLKEMKKHAIATAKTVSKKLGVNVPAAITAVKPSGTVSQLVNSSSGIHTRFSAYYIRRVRVTTSDALCKFLIEKGVKHNPEVGEAYNTANTMVFDFPVESPKACICNRDVSALEQLEYWKMLQNYWCEHKPSCTVFIEEDEWLEVGAWVYKNWDLISGISFLPKADSIYQLAPYEEITQQKYIELKKEMPEINFDELDKFEKEDNTIGAQEFACSGNNCELI